VGPTDPRLSQLATRWTAVRAAHTHLPDGRAAQWELLERYGGAVHRYLLGAVRDPDLAADLAQEFAVRFLQGDLKGADPGKGRFRDFLKGVLQHLVAGHFRKEKRRPAGLPDDLPGPAADDPPADEADRAFQRCWRDELLGRAWAALAAFERETGQPYHTVLRFRVDHPDLTSEAMAGRLGAQLGRAITPAGMRKALQRSREKYAELLLADLAASLGRPTREELERELIDLDLYEYCRPAVERTGDRMA
jgi:DNA-directed RNA polymerase specialized sigma24 family protein